MKASGVGSSTQATAVGAPTMTGVAKDEDNLDMTDLDLLDIGDDEDFEDLGVGLFFPSTFTSHLIIFSFP